MQIALTGPTGHVGASVVRRLLDDGHALRVLVRGDAEALEGLHVERIEADLFDTAALQSLVARAEVVVHLAARISICKDDAAEVRKTNVEGTRLLAQTAHAAGVRRFIHVSSVHAASPHPHDTPFEDDRPPLERSTHASAYDESKAEGERVVKSTMADREFAILRPAGVLGPLDFKRSRMGLTLNQLARGGMRALPDAGYCWVDVRDVAQAIARAVVAAKEDIHGRTFNLAARYASIWELAQIADAARGRKRVRVRVPLALLSATAPIAERLAKVRGAEPRLTPESVAVLVHAHKHMPSEGARATLGFQPRPLETTVKDTIEWWDRHGRV